MRPLDTPPSARMGLGNDNPLLQTLGVPDLSRIEAGHVAPALDLLLAQADAALDRTASDAVPADYDAMSAVLDVAVERLGRAWGAVSHLNEVADTEALRAAYNASLPAVTAFFTRLGAHQGLYQKYRELSQSPAAAALCPARRQALKNSLRDFVLGGAELQGAARQRFAEIHDRVAELQQRFAENLLDATDAFSLDVDAEALAGVPADVICSARALAEAAGLPGYRLSLHAPCYWPVLRQAHSRELRHTLYRAYITCASELGEKRFDNSAVMRELVELRHEEAHLLGFEHYAELSVVPKMADNAAQVRHFVDDLASRARPFGERDLLAVREFAARELGLSELMPWDLPYASERLKQSRFDFSSDQLRQYFTETRVLDGLFDIGQTLFDIQIRPVAAPVWHDSVRVYELSRGAQPLGRFFLDLHARPGKRPGAWMDDAQQRWRRPDTGELQLPVAHLVCNFAAPTWHDGRLQPTLLSHDDVITLFHEFGHGMHHLLTQVDDLAVAGMAGVEWDAVELPSQFMENFCWEWRVLQRLSAHVDTGEALPRELFDRLLAARHFNSGMAMLRQMEYALFDLRIHSEPDAAGRLQAIADEVHAQLGMLPVAPFNRFQHSFSHIFDGAYAAGFYSYSWAEVLSADAWSAFEDADIFDPETGRRYRQCLLEVGGSRPAIDSFKAFRGREPRIDALLRHQGMA